MFGACAHQVKKVLVCVYRVSIGVYCNISAINPISSIKSFRN